jgi:hypothetical protein
LLSERYPKRSAPEHDKVDVGELLDLEKEEQDEVPSRPD